MTYVVKPVVRFTADAGSHLRAVSCSEWRALPSTGARGHWQLNRVFATYSLDSPPGATPCDPVSGSPSDACGLGRASSSAKGWVLAMLARKGELGVALVPRESAPFSPAAYARPSKPHPRADAGTTPAASRAEKDRETMTHEIPQTTSHPPAPARQSITFEFARLAPHRAWPTTSSAPSASNPSIRRDPRSDRGAHRPRRQGLRDGLNEKALQIHLQRIAGAFVGSAYGAAQFYGQKSPARELTCRLPTTTATRTATVPPVSRARPSAPACSPPRWLCRPSP